MKPERIVSIYFSPTGGTARVSETISTELAARLNIEATQISFTRPREREQFFSFQETDLVIVSCPTYAGKLPNKILPDLQSKLKGNGALAIAAVTFGNRSYDNSLAELCALLENNGFRTAAAGAFVCQHAFTDDLAYGRPGWSDQFEIKGFAKKIADKISRLTEIPEPIQVPGDAAAPYYVPKGENGEPVNFLKAKPKTHLSRCNNCGACVRMCPMGAIDPKNVSNVPGTCIKCQCCVRKCTKGAKYFDDALFLSHVKMLEQNFEEPKENEMFL